jgi:4-aminobutyrate aminotransferase
LLPDVHVVPYPQPRAWGGDEDAASAASLAALDRLFAERVRPSEVAAVIIEPVLGEGGYIPAPAEFLRRLRTMCTEQGIVLIFDEVQSGYGRTGRMWAFEHAGAVPDVICLAKGIANGMPLGAFVSRRELHERWGTGAHGSTFGGNPVSCAAGIAVLETIVAEGLVANSAARGEQLVAGLRQLAEQEPRIGDIRGMGLMIGVEMVNAETGEPDGELGNRLLDGCADEGLLVLTCGPAHNAIRWCAPLDVSAEEIDEGLEVFGRVLGSL